MRFSRSEAVALFGWMCLAPAVIFGQQSGDPQSVPSQNSPAVTKPLTPEEQRQKEIDAIDPLAKDPKAAKRSDVRVNQPPPDTQTDSTQNPDTPKPRRSPQPLPGSIAASELARSTEGPQIVGVGDDAEPQYNGPAVLSRTYTLQRPMVPSNVSWSWSIGSTQTYTWGLLSAPATSGQSTQTTGAFGEGATFSLNGRHLWKHDEIGVVYSAGYINYGGQQTSSYSGLNQTLTFDYSHHLSRHLQLNVVETAAVFSQGGSLSNPLLAPGVSVADMNLSISPTLQPFDLTTRQSNTQVGLTWRKSARLSFNYTGALFGVERQGAGLISNSGFQGSTDVNYRFTRKTTVGAAYSYTTYSFSHNFAAANSHTVDVVYSYAIGRAAQFRSRVGVSTMRNSGLTLAPVDPVIAALTGQTVGIVEQRISRLIPDISAQLVKDFHGRHTASLAYARGISPGNGAVLTATQESYSVSYGTTLFHRYTFAISGGKSSLNGSLGPSPLGAQSYNSEFAGVTLARTLPHNVSANFGATYRRYEATGLFGTQPQISINTGISWGPGEGRLW